MARYLLQKQKDSLVVFTSMKEIASVFVSELRAAVDVDSQSAFAAVLDVVEPPLPEKHQATTVAQAKSKAKAQAKAQAEAGHLPLYDLNSRGEVISGVGRLHALGFDLGSTVVLAPPHRGLRGRLHNRRRGCLGRGQASRHSRRREGDEHAGLSVPR